jgi:hypothetical protein
MLLVPMGEMTHGGGVGSYSPSCSFFRFGLRSLVGPVQNRVQERVLRVLRVQTSFPELTNFHEGALEDLYCAMVPHFIIGAGWCCSSPEWTLSEIRISLFNGWCNTCQVGEGRTQSPAFHPCKTFWLTPSHRPSHSP